ncbi:Outer Dynein Arm Docking Complex [Thraustotheca clavata]|uniref:Outer Dynein Arm Docking Complex n=1 Tax=Thraustotheca clavata TaxID=74557 RepID=A0A1W0AC47_9STRA|nr:Outer Dynein Arm Docking Complex [Thraustotheca clavata]
MLGENVVTDVNMMQYLGMVEQRTNEILQLYAAFQKNRAAAVDIPDHPVLGTFLLKYMYNCLLGHGLSSHQLHAALGIGPPTPMGAEQLQINPPNLEDYSSDEEEMIDHNEMHPLSRDELKLRTLKGLRRSSGFGQISTGQGKEAKKKLKKPKV